MGLLSDGREKRGLIPQPLFPQPLFPARSPGLLLKCLDSISYGYLFKWLDTRGDREEPVDAREFLEWQISGKICAGQVRRPARPSRGSVQAYYFLLFSLALYMYLIEGLYTIRLGAPTRFIFRQFLSYHSMTPWTCSPSRSTRTMGVFACICFW
jgi:hypothetical protein